MSHISRLEYNGIFCLSFRRVRLTYLRFGHGEYRPVDVIEAVGDLPRKLDVLLLILADGNVGCSSRRSAL